MTSQFDKDLLLAEAMMLSDQAQMANALENGADPYLLTQPYTALSILTDYGRAITGKAEFARKLLLAGPNLDLIRERYTDGEAPPQTFDGNVLSMGSYSKTPVAGDTEFSVLVMSHLIAYDLEKQGYYLLPVDERLAEVGAPYILPGSSETERRHVAEIMRHNQHALVDYVATSEDPAAKFLRYCTDYAGSEFWLVKMNPINPDQHSRPSPQYVAAMKAMMQIIEEGEQYKGNIDMLHQLTIDVKVARDEMLRQPRSWKPPVATPPGITAPKLG